MADTQARQPGDPAKAAILSGSVSATRKVSLPSPVSQPCLT